MKMRLSRLKFLSGLGSTEGVWEIITSWLVPPIYRICRHHAPYDNSVGMSDESEMQKTLHECYNALAETTGAIDIIVDLSKGYDNQWYFMTRIP